MPPPPNHDADVRVPWWLNMKHTVMMNTLYWTAWEYLLVVEPVIPDFSMGHSFFMLGSSTQENLTFLMNISLYKRIIAFPFCIGGKFLTSKYTALNLKCSVCLIAFHFCIWNNCVYTCYDDEADR